MVMAKSSTRVRICVRLAPDRTQRCLLIPQDDEFARRFAAVECYERSLRGSQIGPDLAASPPAYRRARLTLLLAVHDGLEAGATTRDLAFNLIFARHLPLSGATWKGSGERRHTHRLIADARRITRTDYALLLKRSQRVSESST